MRSCDTCPGSNECAATNLHPVLAQVFSLYASGVTDKFDILFALEPESEALLEKFNSQISPDCWSKAALLTIADTITTLIVGLDSSPPLADTFRQRIEADLAMAVDAFSRFPWAVAELVEQAPDLYQEIVDRTADAAFADHMSKRNFVKLCKQVAYR
ncbi:MAG TPA: hypothetical protein ENI69_08770 [Rhodospirillales bacterium]|nr:hypothetical protein [Rhodospirillales bacterium]